jgi:hypothetical protein
VSHDWVEIDRQRPCFRLKRCTRCDEEQDIPDHDWEARPGGPDGIEMICSRCEHKI